jgi:RNA 2',3'-cyclic 3'-phosphodiesterase
MNPIQPEVEYRRCFVALPLPPEVVTSARQSQRHVQNTVGQLEVRWVKPEQMHLTLRFMGQVAADQIPALIAELDRIATATPTFQLRTGLPGCFPNHGQPRVIWLGLAGDLAALARLQNAVAQATQPWGDPTDDKAFQPHLTLGRVKTTRPRESGALRAALTHGPALAVPSWLVSSLDLIQSTLSPAGPVYGRLASLRLRQGE